MRPARLLASLLLPLLLATTAAAATETAPAAEAARPYEVDRSLIVPVPEPLEGRRYEVFVRLPPGYDAPENAGRRWPVVYLTDAHYPFQLAAGLTRMPFNQGALDPFILVGLSYAVGEDGTESRRRDYTTVQDPRKASATGGAPAFFAYLRDSILPFVEGRWRIDPTKRVLVGQSYGALFGFYVLFTEPELFGAYILTSPSIWYGGRDLLKREAAYAAKHKDLKAHLYVATGGLEKPGGCRGCDVDMVADQHEMVKRLKSRNWPGLTVKAEILDGLHHETTFPVGLTRGLQWLFLSDSKVKGAGW